MKKRLPVLFLLLLCWRSTTAQMAIQPVPVYVQPDSSSTLLVGEVAVVGNKKTKRYIIQREMLFHSGDSIKAGNLYTLITESEKLVYNTNLFTNVTIIPSLVVNNAINFTVIVKERWYIYPLPQFQLIDRNFNEWVNIYNADINRTVYGAKFSHYNFSGRKDQLRIFALSGYSRNLSFTYSSPYSNNKLTEGFSFGAGFTQNRILIYKTTANNRILQFNNGNFVRQAFNVQGTYLRRKGYYRSHLFSFNYLSLKINDSILSEKYNPDYFNSNRSTQQIPEFGYTTQYLRVDNINYPLIGQSSSIGITKRGFQWRGGINMTMIDGFYNRFLSLGKKWYCGISVMGKIKAPFNLAYYNRRALGFGDFNLRGLEYYVVDGAASAITKVTIRKKIYEFFIKPPILKKIIPEIPFRFYGKTYGDAGISYLPKSTASMLNNKILYSGGFGLDIVTLYDLVIKLEFSFNQLGEKGLFLQTKGGF